MVSVIRYDHWRDGGIAPRVLPSPARDLLDRERIVEAIYLHIRTGRVQPSHVSQVRQLILRYGPGAAD